MNDQLADLVFTIAPLLIYFLPTMIAFRRHLNKRYAVLACNLTLGWLIIPGLVLFVYTLFTDDTVLRTVEA